MSSDLDGVIAAPHHHTVVFENAFVRVIETVVPAGDSTPVHTHLAPTLSQVQNFAHFVRRDTQGKVLFDSRAAGMSPDTQYVFAETTLEHTIENTDTSDFRVIGIELKR